MNVNGPPGMLMNPATGGPVGAAQMPGQPGLPLNEAQGEDLLRRFNTCIYDHFLKTKQYDVARTFLSSVSPKIKTRADQKLNGASDPKDDPKRPLDLPAPDLPPHTSEHSWLMDWFCMFWDTFNASRRKDIFRQGSMDYVQQQRIKSHMLNPNDPKTMAMKRMNMQNWMGMQGRNQQQMQQEMQNRKMMGMQRDPSNMEMGRPHTPGGSMQDAPSPKRAKLDDGSAFATQGMQPGNRPMNQMMNNGMADGQMSFAGPNGQPKIEGLAGMGELEYMNPRMNNGQNATGEGRHALQDYQMQLMLLEQQNKKRLMQARKEQETINQLGHQGPGGQGGNQGMFAPNMSPSTSRGGGPSPNPADVRRMGGTPKMPQQGLPGSPMPDGARNSPAPNMENGQMQPGMPQNYYQMARPPSSHPNFPPGMTPQQQMEAMRNGQRMPNGSPWQGGQPMPNNGGPNGPTAMAQRPGGNMAPPPAPADGGPPPAVQRPQESSPAQPPAPPTPSQANKAAPKGKKEPAKGKKAAAKKGGTGGSAAAAAATPASEAEAPTPTPSTPITPHPPRDSFSKPGAQQPPPANAPAPNQAAQPAVDPNASQMFTAQSDMNDGGFSLDFTDINGGDLESFDFDSFLQSGDDTGLNFAMDFNGDSGVEAGASNV